MCPEHLAMAVAGATSAAGLFAYGKSAVLNQFKMHTQWYAKGGQPLVTRHVVNTNKTHTRMNDRRGKHVN